jgi:hypothetical protein
VQGSLRCARFPSQLAQCTRLCGQDPSDSILTAAYRWAVAASDGTETECSASRRAHVRRVIAEDFVSWVDLRRRRSGASPHAVALNSMPSSVVDDQSVETLIQVYITPPKSLELREARAIAASAASLGPRPHCVEPCSCTVDAQQSHCLNRLPRAGCASNPAIHRVAMSARLCASRGFTLIVASQRRHSGTRECDSRHTRQSCLSQTFGTVRASGGGRSQGWRAA